MTGPTKIEHVAGNLFLQDQFHQCNMVLLYLLMWLLLKKWQKKLWQLKPYSLNSLKFFYHWSVLLYSTCIVNFQCRFKFLYIFIGLVTRQCKDGGTWGRVLGIHNCFSIDFASLQNTSRQLERFYVGGTDTDELDYTQSATISDSRSVSRWLRSLTNTTTSLVPMDLNAANDILRAVLRYA